MGAPNLPGVIERITHSINTGEPTLEEIETADALKKVANIKPTDDFLEKQGQGDSGSDDDDMKSKNKRKSRNKGSH